MSLKDVTVTIIFHDLVVNCSQLNRIGGQPPSTEYELTVLEGNSFELNLTKEDEYFCGTLDEVISGLSNFLDSDEAIVKVGKPSIELKFSKTSDLETIENFINLGEKVLLSFPMTKFNVGIDRADTEFELCKVGEEWVDYYPDKETIYFSGSIANVIRSITDILMDHKSIHALGKPVIETKGEQRYATSAKNRSKV